MKDTLKDKEQPLETKTEEEKESQPNLSDLTKELEELRAFKVKTEAEQVKVKQETNQVRASVMDSFTSKHEEVTPHKPKTNTEKHWEDMFNKGAFYRE